MGPRRETLEHLSDAIQELARQDAMEVLAEARAGARARVRSTLTEALAEAMLDHAREQLLPAGRQPAERRRSSADAARSAPSGGDRVTGRHDPNVESAPRDPGAEPAQPDVESAPHGPAAESVWYLYGVVAAHQAPPPAELTDAEARQPLEAVTEGPLAAVVSRVPAEEFAENELRSHLNDMDWVEAVARGHERVLDELCRRTTVIPMRLCTVYKTEGGIREMLLRESEALVAALEHLDGKTEWGVKVFFERPRGSRASSRDTASSEEGSGAAYMDHRRLERDRARQLDEQVEAAVSEIHERLDSLSGESTLNPPQRPEVSAHPGEMVLNGAYLIEHGNETEFHAETDALQSRFASVGLELVVTGPWPAYNFLPGRIGAAW
jgi:hypothetical protein